eukprot:TRINITY_DN6145_c0_g1_i2.p1 TRINITY_DN6145_c0_g1~~TRINITY_DN6145_c0_g1_i2.p1  ORF type:complete len:440 (+),score=90.91 TRINITY_DN6145_c0_g1_i2:75-1394(+)
MSRRKEKKSGNAPHDDIDNDAHLSAPSASSNTPKRNKKGQRNRRDDDEMLSDSSETDQQSVAQIAVVQGKDADEHMDHSQALSELIDNLGEKRASTRETALKKLYELMTRNYLADDLESTTETLADALKRSYKKGGEEERKMCLRCIALLFITMGESPNAFKDIYPILRQTIYDAEPENMLAPMAMEVLGLVTFFGCVEESDTEAALTFCAQVAARKHVPLLATAALRAETFLLTSYGPVTIIKNYYIEMLERDSVLLGDENIDVRLATAEQIAFLVESRQDTPTETLGDYDDASELSQILHQMHEVSAISDRHQSKQDRSRLRSGLREIIQYLEHKENPVEHITINKSKHTFETWREILQIQYVREMTGTGFGYHMQHNEILHQIFDIDGLAPQTTMTKTERRLNFSANSSLNKARAQNRNKGRDRKSTMRTAILSDD